jgi:hypothetical protein
MKMQFKYRGVPSRLCKSRLATRLGKLSVIALVFIIAIPAAVAATPHSTTRDMPAQSRSDSDDIGQTMSRPQRDSHLPGGDRIRNDQPAQPDPPGDPRQASPAAAGGLKKPY